MRWPLFSFLALMPLLAAEESLLSALRTEKLQLQEQRIDAQQFVERYRWLSPLQLGYTIRRLDDPQQTSNSFVVSIDQPLFQSGGISAQIDLGDAQAKLSRLLLTQNRQDAVRTVVDTLLQLQKNRYMLQKQRLLVENATIDVERKTAQYQEGLTDGSFLDNAMLAKNALENALIETQTLVEKLLAKFKAYSDADEAAVKPPHFSAQSIEAYISNSIAVQSAKVESEMAEAAKRVTLSSYLPSVSLFGSYTDSRVSPQSIYSQNTNQSAFGVRFSLLLDPKGPKSYEAAKLDLLVAQKKAVESELEQRFVIQSSFASLKNFEQKIELAKKDALSYASLLEQTQAMESAGLKTYDDVRVLKNSKLIKELEAKIYEIDRQIELASLFFNTSNGG